MEHHPQHNVGEISSTNFNLRRNLADSADHVTYSFVDNSHQFAYLLTSSNPTPHPYQAHNRLTSHDPACVCLNHSTSSLASSNQELDDMKRDSQWSPRKQSSPKQTKPAIFSHLEQKTRGKERPRQDLAAWPASSLIWAQLRKSIPLTNVGDDMSSVMKCELSVYLFNEICRSFSDIWLYSGYSVAVAADKVHMYFRFNISLRSNHQVTLFLLGFYFRYILIPACNRKPTCFRCIRIGYACEYDTSLRKAGVRSKKPLAPAPVVNSQPQLQSTLIGLLAYQPSIALYSSQQEYQYFEYYRNVTAIKISGISFYYPNTTVQQISGVCISSWWYVYTYSI